MFYLYYMYVYTYIYISILFLRFSAAVCCATIFSQPDICCCCCCFCLFCRHSIMNLYEKRQLFLLLLLSILLCTQNKTQLSVFMSRGWFGGGAQHLPNNFKPDSERIILYAWKIIHCYMFTGFLRIPFIDRIVLCVCVCCCLFFI